MKTQIGLHLNVGTADELRAVAVAAGASIGDLADLLIRRGLATLKPDALRAWAAAQPNTRGKLGGALRRDERLVLDAIKRLKVSEAPAWRFSGTIVADTAGLKRTPAFWALKSLAARGMVIGSELEELDRWQRPVKSYWRLAGDGPAPQPVG